MAGNGRYLSEIAELHFVNTSGVKKEKTFENIPKLKWVGCKHEVIPVAPENLDALCDR